MPSQVSRISHFLLFCLLLTVGHGSSVEAQGQDWNENYDADNLYHDYAMRQQEKEAAAAA
jgi:hypothetical protein